MNVEGSTMNLISQSTSVVNKLNSKQSVPNLVSSKQSVSRVMSKRALALRSKQAIKTLKAQSAQFSKDIVTEEFYVLQTDEEPNQNELDKTDDATHTTVSIVEPEKSKKEDANKDIEFTLVDDQETSTEEEVAAKKKKSEHEEQLDKDFFERGVDEDAEKKKVIQEIAGMSEATEVEGIEEEGTEEEATAKKATAEQATEKRTSEKQVSAEQVTATVPEETLKESLRSATIQFKRSEMAQPTLDSEKPPESIKSSLALAKDTSKRSLDNQPRMSRRPSGIPELIKLSKKSLVALTGSSDGTGFKRSMTEERMSFVKKDVFETFASSAIDLHSGSKVVSDFKRVPKLSVYGSWAYAELGPRYQQTDDEDLLAGFDIGGDAPIFFDVMPEEEEHIEVKEEEVPFKLERKPYYERHDKAAQEIEIQKIKNFIYHKKLAMYFKRKKMDYVTKETDWSFDSQTKYFKKLEAYGDLMNFIAIERGRVSQEIEGTKEEKNERFRKLTNMFKKMQDREGEIGYGLINTKTGNVLPDKFVERLIRRQYTQMMQVSSMRLTFIRLKDMVQEKLDAIASLDEIAPGFLLADFEQLKSDNRAYADKIEEKDEELSRLRARCSSTIQVLAHLREKTTALDNDLEDLLEERRLMQADSFAARSRLNDQKQFRDNIRHAINKMRDESGLLTQPTLLKDMEKGLEDTKTLTDQLNKITKEHRKKAKQIKLIRKKIEQTVDIRRTGKSLTRMQTVKDDTRKEKYYKLYKGRPSLMIPVIEDTAFHSLKTIKPKLTYDRSLRNRPNVKHTKRKEG